MTDTPEIAADTPDTAADTPDIAAAFATIQKAIEPSTNIDGWTGARQRRFLEAIADGESVRRACYMVGLSSAAAYAFRRRAKGRAFDLGWKAADLLAREQVADMLMTRALSGQDVVIERPDGSLVTRSYKDNRLAVQMLARLDRYADASESTAPGHAARVVAGDFDAYLDVIGADGGPARAGLFMMARAVDGDTPASELEPIVALARADRHLRCGTLADDVDVADLDPAHRADWTAEQWRRAEASGVVALAPEPEPAKPAPQPAPPPPSTYQPVSTYQQKPVWFDDGSNSWHTYFPPPEDFIGEESGDWNDDDYERELTEEELEQLGLQNPDPEAELAEREAERDAWFAAHAVKPRPVATPKPAPAPAAKTEEDEEEEDDDGEDLVIYN